MVNFRIGKKRVRAGVFGDVERDIKREERERKKAIKAEQKLKRQRQKEITRRKKSKVRAKKVKKVKTRFKKGAKRAGKELTEFKLSSKTFQKSSGVTKKKLFRPVRFR